MKKIFAIFMLAIVGFCVFGCNGNEEDPVVPVKPVISIEETTLTLEVGDTHTFNVDINILMESSSNSVVSCDEATKTITARAAGEATVTIYALEDTTVFKTITVTVESGEGGTPTAIEIVSEKTTLYLDDTLELSVAVTPANASQEIEWINGSKSIISVSEDGVVTPLRAGNARIKVVSALDSTVNAIIDLVVLNSINPDTFFGNINFEDPINETIKAYGYHGDGTGSAKNYEYNLLGSITKYLFDDITITEDLTPLATITQKTDSETGEVYDEYSNGRSGEKIREYRYVVVHDTADTSSFGTAVSLGNWVESQTSSWHYCVDDTDIVQKIPLNEVAWHAGDGADYTDAIYYNTGIKATGTEPAKVTISTDGYFVLNGTKSKLAAPKKTVDGEVLPAGQNIPTNEDLPYTGIENYVDPTTGTYWIGKTWWSETYQTVGNYGGSTHSIGIETSVVKGDNIWYVWNRTAKLIATVIMPATGMTPDDLRQHNTFSGKDCPMTMRHAGHWENFVELVKAEYYINTYFSDYTIELVCNSPYVTSTGLIKSLPTTTTNVSYSIKVSNGTDFNKTYNFSFTLSPNPTRNIDKYISNSTY